MMKQNKKTALVYAVDLLARQAYSIKMLTDKLRRKGYLSEEIEEAIEKLRTRSYLDDEALCQSMYRRYVGEGKHSLRHIEYNLRQKGFDDAAIGAARREGDEAAEVVAARRIVRARYRLGGAEETAKIAQFLYRKGFDKASIREAFSSFAGEICNIIDE